MRRGGGRRRGLFLKEAGYEGSERGGGGRGRGHVARVRGGGAEERRQGVVVVLLGLAAIRASPEGDAGAIRYAPEEHVLRKALCTPFVEAGADEAEVEESYKPTWGAGSEVGAADKKLVTSDERSKEHK